MSFIALWSLKALWGWLYSSASIATLIGAAATAIAILEPKFLDAVTDLRKWAIVVAAVAFAYVGIAGKFYEDGLYAKQAEWNAALDREVKDGEAARAAAVAANPPSTDRGLYAHDKRNRDLDTGATVPVQPSALRRLAGHHLFGKK